MQKLSRTLLLAAVASLAAPVFAAQPEPGYWVFDNELNGKPGRGLQIESPVNSTTILSYHGYRQDGSATFYQAVGNLSGPAWGVHTFKADLVEYKNGPALGGPVQDGEVSQVVGPVQVRFNTSHSGSITLPGEPEQPISRFVYADFRVGLNNTFLINFFFDKSNVSSTQPFGAVQTRFTIKDNVMTAILKAPNGAICHYEGDFTREGTGFASTGKWTVCEDSSLAPHEPTYVRFKKLTVNGFGELSATYLTSDREATFSENPYAGSVLFGKCYRPFRIYFTEPPLPLYVEMCREVDGLAELKQPE